MIEATMELTGVSREFATVWMVASALGTSAAIMVWIECIKRAWLALTLGL